MTSAIKGAFQYFLWLCKCRSDWRSRLVLSGWVFVGILTYPVPVNLNWHWQRFTEAR